MKKSIAIFGGGPASFALASFIDSSRYQTTIYEKNKTCGRKFLVAGKGGFNLTYSEPLDQFTKRYIPESFMAESLMHFDNQSLRTWLHNLGIETYIGSSHRVFPIKGIKPIEVLEAILKYIANRGIEIQYQKKWTGWSKDGFPEVNHEEEIKADYYVYAFGGASWTVTGSDGFWSEHFKAKGISLNDFEASNCAFEVNWPDEFIKRFEGEPLKNIAVSCCSKTQKGELVITQFGLEGNAIYALSHAIREELKSKKESIITIDFKPIFSKLELQSKIQNSNAKNTTSFLRNDLNLSKVQINMIKALTTKEAFVNKEILVDIIKGLEVKVVRTAPVDEAISTVGGIDRRELTPNFELKKLKKSFCIGEMVDWDAPTGGYLLQGCMSMGVYLASQLNKT